MNEDEFIAFTIGKRSSKIATNHFIKLKQLDIDVPDSLKNNRNFHVYIHDNTDFIEKGVKRDDRKFYKIYY